MRDPVGRIKFRRYLLPVFSAYVFLVGFEGECQQETGAWRDMGMHTAALIGPNRERLEFPVKVADEEHERRAGFQHICPAVIAKVPMLFVFPRSVRVSFHMNNVYAPLQIGFFDASGILIDVQIMETYGPPPKERRLYGPRQRVRAVLETEVGFFNKHGISPGQWRLVYPAE